MGFTHVEDTEMKILAEEEKVKDEVRSMSMDLESAVALFPSPCTGCRLWKPRQTKLAKQSRPSPIRWHRNPKADRACSYRLSHVSFRKS